MYRSLKLICSILLILSGCCNTCQNKNELNKKEEVVDPSKMNAQVKIIIEKIIAGGEIKDYRLLDSSFISYHDFLKNYYTNSDFEPIWCSKKIFLPQAILLIKYIENAALQGLYKDDYHFKILQKIKSLLDTDSIKKSMLFYGPMQIY